MAEKSFETMDAVTSLSFISIFVCVLMFLYIEVRIKRFQIINVNGKKYEIAGLAEIDQKDATYYQPIYREEK